MKPATMAKKVGTGALMVVFIAWTQLREKLKNK